MNTILNENSDQLRAQIEDFRHLSSTLAKCGEKHGVEIVPYRGENLPFFSRKSADERLQILKELRASVTICEIASADVGGHSFDTVALTWAAIKQLGYRPSSDLFSYIGPENVIEIHDPTGLQMFRNFNFYHYCSYSLEELHCFSWSQLYKRNEEVLVDLFKVAEKIYAGEIKNTVAMNLPEHTIEELFSPFKYKILAEVTHIAPLFDSSGRPAATIAIERGRLSGQIMTAEEEESALLSAMGDVKPPLDLV